MPRWRRWGSCPMTIKLIPHEVILVDEIPKCDFCDDPGPYDFKSDVGPWAHGCGKHWRRHGAYSELGTGKGQLWVTEDQLDATE
jgi:hypothetical protein